MLAVLVFPLIFDSIHNPVSMDFMFIIWEYFLYQITF